VQDSSFHFAHFALSKMQAGTVGDLAGFTRHEKLFVEVRFDFFIWYRFQAASFLCEVC